MLMHSCKKPWYESYELILGEWKIIATSKEGSNDWFLYPTSSKNTLRFESDYTYSTASHDVTYCNGKYEFINKTSIKIMPEGCFPIDIESLETIYKLTKDTLIITDHQIGYLSYTPVNKYIRLY
jgi:hypothetical protein